LIDLRNQAAIFMGEKLAITHPLVKVLEAPPPRMASQPRG